VPRRIRKAEAWPSVPQHDGPCEPSQVSQQPARASHQHAPAQNTEKPCRRTHNTPIFRAKGANTMLRGRLTSPRSPLPALRARRREPRARSRPKGRTQGTVRGPRGDCAPLFLLFPRGRFTSFPPTSSVHVRWGPAAGVHNVVPTVFRIRGGASPRWRFSLRAPCSRSA
jgi:hypothetical protein